MKKSLAFLGTSLSSFFCSSLFFLFFFLGIPLLRVQHHTGFYRRHESSAAASMWKAIEALPADLYEEAIQSVTYQPQSKNEAPSPPPSLSSSSTPQSPLGLKKESTDLQQLSSKTATPKTAGAQTPRGGGGGGGRQGKSSSRGGGGRREGRQTRFLSRKVPLSASAYVS